MPRSSDSDSRDPADRPRRKKSSGRKASGKRPSASRDGEPKRSGKKPSRKGSGRPRRDDDSRDEQSAEPGGRKRSGKRKSAAKRIRVGEQTDKRGPKAARGGKRPAKKRPVSRKPARTDDADGFGDGVDGEAAARPSRSERVKSAIKPVDADAPRFDEFDLPPSILKAIKRSGYETATPIQAAAIPPALAGHDVLGSAQTGTGKTAAFALPTLALLAESPGKAAPKRPRCLVLAPTRELAAQIDDSFQTYGENLKLRSTVIFGGVGQGKQTAAMRRGVHILVATPGRLLDLMDQGYIDLGHLEMFILDEADRMMDMGFMPALKRVISELPDDRQSLFFSATLPPAILELAESLLIDPTVIDVTPPERSVKLIEQSVQFVPKAEKPERLYEGVTGADVKQAIVFTRTKRGANTVAERLDKHGVDAEAIHGNKSQNARTRTLDRFRDGRCKVLVATDLAARGLDIDDITHVINYELPNEPESYVHRIGRSGRAGAEGKAIAFCDAAEKQFLRDIEKLIGMKVPVDGEDNVGEAPPEKVGGKRRGRGGRPGGGGSGGKRGGARGKRRTKRS